MENDALESVLDDLRELARAYPAIASAMLRFLRELRDLIVIKYSRAEKETAPDAR